MPPAPPSDIIDYMYAEIPQILAEQRAALAEELRS
jgi:hypothetical protein